MLHLPRAAAVDTESYAAELDEDTVLLHIRHTCQFPDTGFHTPNFSCLYTLFPAPYSPAT